ncbi:MAG: nuclear transport factor 2 family protein [Propionibacteriaceae bacterium]|nr:nuclear transport factor 2 family protein [Propionibacteriaceae bacterium]
MTTPPSLPAAIAAWVEADRHLELDAMRAQLAPTVVLRSPLTDAFTFTGPDAVGHVFGAAFDLLSDIEITRVTGHGDDWVVHGTNTLDGHNLEEIQWLHLDADGLIDEVTLFIRPVPAAIGLFAQIGNRLATRGVLPRRAGVAAASLAPFAAVFRGIERFVMPRVGPGRIRRGAART